MSSGMPNGLAITVKPQVLSQSSERYSLPLDLVGVGQSDYIRELRESISIRV